MMARSQSSSLFLRMFVNQKILAIFSRHVVKHVSDMFNSREYLKFSTHAVFYAVFLLIVHSVGMKSVNKASARSAGASACSGIMLLRYNKGVIKFVNAWQQRLQQKAGQAWDQQEFNDLLRINMFKNHYSWWDHTDRWERYVPTTPHPSYSFHPVSVSSPNMLSLHVGVASCLHCLDACFDAACRHCLITRVSPVSNLAEDVTGWTPQSIWHAIKDKAAVCELHGAEPSMVVNGIVVDANTVCVHQASCCTAGRLAGLLSHPEKHVYSTTPLS